MSILCFLRQYLLSCRKPGRNRTPCGQGAQFSPPFAQARGAHPRSEAWLLIKLLVYGSVLGARHAVPLQLRRLNAATFIEFATDLLRVCEKFKLGGGAD